MGSLPIHCDASLLPPVEPIFRADPYAAVARRQNGRGSRTGQLFSHRERAYGRFTELIQTVGGSNPDCPLMVLEQGDYAIARQAVGVRKHAGFALVGVNKPMTVSADPQSTVAIAQEMCGRQREQRARKRVIYQLSADDLTNAIQATMTPEPSSPCVKAWKLGILADGKRAGGPGFHRHSPVAAATQRLPSESSYKDVTTAPSLPSSPEQVVLPPRIAQSFPVGP